MFITYLQGWFLNWRTIGWVNLLYILIPVCLTSFIYESPYWLISRDRFDDAKASLNWFHKNQPKVLCDSKHFSALKLEELIEEERKKRINNTEISLFKELCKPTSYKPLFVLTGLHFFQQFSGIYVFLCYSIYFFEASGTTINPFLGSVLLGLIRLILSASNTWIMKKTTRRFLLIFTTVGMGISLIISGMSTYWIDKGNTLLRPVPTIFLLVYAVCSIFGLLTIPWTMSAEMFPLRIRAVAQGILTGIAFEILFVVIQSFSSFEYIFGGFAGVQWFFAAMSLLGVVYIYIFVPETHNKDFAEIEEYFKTNVFYYRYKKRENV